jgi:hypothetical protein
MKGKKFILIALIMGFILYSLSVNSMAAQQEKKAESKIIIIPDTVKSIFNQGIQTREPRLDIPFSIVWHIYLPARENMHAVFYFKAKNKDLGFIPLPQVTEPTEEKKEEEKAQPPATETPALMQTNGHVFIQFNRMEKGAVKEVAKEVYIPLNLQTEGESYDPEKEEFYSTGYPLPPGDYLLSMAIASLDLNKIGTQYFEFSLPDSSLFTEELGTTPIFSVEKIEKMEAAETKAEIHKGFFTYSFLQITPNIESVFSVGENLDIFFYVFGVRPNEQGKFDIEVSYEVLKGEERIIRYAKAQYDTPIVSQPLPIKQTVIITKEEGGQKTEEKEQRDVDPGQYILNIEIKDNVTGKSVVKSYTFEVKEKSA